MQWTPSSRFLSNLFSFVLKFDYNHSFNKIIFGFESGIFTK